MSRFRRSPRHLPATGRETPRRRAYFVAAVAAVCLPLLSGCLTVQAIEPVLSPPPVYQIDVSVPVEFVSPPLVGVRCAERGAKFLGLPGFNSGACADLQLVTMPDPCLTFTAGWYGALLCREITPERAARNASTPPELSDGPDGLVPALASPASRAASGPDLYRAAFTPGGRTRLPSPARRIHGGADAGADVRSAAPAPGLSGVRLQIEFIAPQRVAYRCAERGAKFNPGSAFGACRDETLVTLPNPCLAITAGWYARTLCHELAHANGWPANHAGGRLKTQAPVLMARDSPQAIAHMATQTLASLTPETSPTAAPLSPDSASDGSSPLDVPIPPASAPAPDAAAQPPSVLVALPATEGLFEPIPSAPLVLDLVPDPILAAEETPAETLFRSFDPGGLLAFSLVSDNAPPMDLFSSEPALVLGHLRELATIAPLQSPPSEARTPPEDDLEQRFERALALVSGDRPPAGIGLSPGLASLGLVSLGSASPLRRVTDETGASILDPLSRPREAFQLSWLNRSDIAPERSPVALG